MKYKKWFAFWEKNLADPFKSCIDVEKLNYFEIDDFDMNNNVVSQSGKINQLIDIEELNRNKKIGIKNRRDNNWVSLSGMHVLIAPIKIKPKEEALANLNDTNEKFPFWYFAKVDREGNLGLPDDTFPIFQRRFLRPLKDGYKEFVFGTLENVDKVKNCEKREFLDYSDYIRYLNTVFKEVVGNEVYNYHKPGYEVINNGVVLLPRRDILLLLESLNFVKNY